MNYPTLDIFPNKVDGEEVFLLSHLPLNSFNTESVSIAKGGTWGTMKRAELEMNWEILN